MLFDETLFEVFEADNILLVSLKCLKKNDIFSTSINILESFYVLGHTI